ncbi:hypothetical protein FNF27_01142 [Cafeteria roenbergensis]|uniref:Uncharacterized protein n=1 Tax=Cafeteria roenbergensis TaxID=33653 RepID=A0A5A8EJC5_CAFRO|nr:hypothetical protein FNF27_01142 [Cafeteria roenbergensis]
MAWRADQYGSGNHGPAFAGDLYEHAGAPGGFDMGTGSPGQGRAGGGDMYAFDLGGTSGAGGGAAARGRGASAKSQSRQDTLAMAAEILGRKSVPTHGIQRQSAMRRGRITDSDISLSASESTADGHMGESAETERERRRRERAAALDRRLTVQSSPAGRPGGAGEGGFAAGTTARSGAGGRLAGGSARYQPPGGGAHLEEEEEEGGDDDGLGFEVYSDDDGDDGSAGGGEASEGGVGAWGAGAGVAGGLGGGLDSGPAVVMGRGGGLGGRGAGGDGGGGGRGFHMEDDTDYAGEVEDGDDSAAFELEGSQDLSRAGSGRAAGRGGAGGAASDSASGFDLEDTQEMDPGGAPAADLAQARAAEVAVA